MNTEPQNKNELIEGLPEDFKMKDKQRIEEIEEQFKEFARESINYLVDLEDEERQLLFLWIRHITGVNYQCSSTWEENPITGVPPYVKEMVEKVRGFHAGLNNDYNRVFARHIPKDEINN